MNNTRIKILAIDDNQDNLITIKALIYESFPNAIVLSALNGLHGLQLALNEDPDVILLDVIMPDMDGFEVCAQLKKHQTLKDIPVVFVTALKEHKESRIRGLEAGAEAFLSKPIDVTELVAQIRAMIKIKAANIQRRDENVRLISLVKERTSELNKTHTATLNLLEDLKNENEARKKTEDALRESEELYRAILDASPDNIIITDIVGEVLMTSPGMLRKYGYPENKTLVGRTISEFVIQEDVKRVRDDFSLVLKGLLSGPNEYRSVRADGSLFYIEVKGGLIKNSDNQVVKLVFTARDVSERKIAEEKHQHVARLYALLSQVNQAVVRTHTKTDLFKTICQVAIEHGQFRMAWVGVKNHHDSGAKVIAFAGYEKGYLTSVDLSDSSDMFYNRLFKQSTQLEAIVACNEIASESSANSWKVDAIDRSYHSMASVPLFRNGKVYAALNLYSSEVGFFSEDEQNLLIEIGEDISYALDALDAENDRIAAEEALEHSQLELKTIYDHAPVMMCLLDRDRNILFANQAFSSLTGISEQNLKGGLIGDVIRCIHSNDHYKGCGFGESCKECNLKTALERTFITGNVERNIEYHSSLVIGSDKKEFYLLGSTAIIHSSEEDNLLLCLHDITTRKKAEEALTESQAQLKKFAAHLQNVREEERVLLAREIHDELGQILIAMKIDMGMLKNYVLKKWPDDEMEKVVSYFDNLFGLVDNTIRTTRKIMTDLRPEVLDLLGFADAVKQYVTKYQERHKIKCHFANEIPGLVFSSQQSVALFRIIQESLTNVAKHAKASEVFITVQSLDSKLVLEIKDNGVGFNDKNKKNNDSYGLIGMKERVLILDGELQIVSSVGNGTLVKIVMPFNQTDLVLG